MQMQQGSMKGEFSTFAEEVLQQHQCHPWPNHDTLHPLNSQAKSVSFCRYSSIRKSFVDNEYGINGMHNGIVLPTRRRIGSGLVNWPIQPLAKVG